MESSILSWFGALVRGSPTADAASPNMPGAARSTFLVLAKSRVPFLAPSALDATAHLIVLLCGEAGLRCGEMIALEWRDVDLGKRQICVQRSDWNGQVTTPKGGRFVVFRFESVQNDPSAESARLLNTPTV